MTWTREKAEESYERNLHFLRSLRSVEKATVAQEVKQIHNSVFAKTDCLDCANCCKSSPPIVTKKDSKRMGKALGLPPKTVIRKHLIQDIDGSLMMNGVPCTFLNEDNSCQIYEYRPEACRRYPHTDEADFALRPEFNANNTLVCPAAFRIVELLKKHLS